MARCGCGCGCGCGCLSIVSIYLYAHEYTYISGHEQRIETRVQLETTCQCTSHSRKNATYPLSPQDIKARPSGLSSKRKKSLVIISVHVAKTKKKGIFDASRCIYSAKEPHYMRVDCRKVGLFCTTFKNRIVQKLNNIPPKSPIIWVHLCPATEPYSFFSTKVPSFLKKIPIL